MKQYTADKIRNVALAGHSSAGKTSLAEMLLFKSGATDRLGKIADGNTVCDFDPEEIKRQVSVSSAIAPFDWNGVKINLLDTPGMFDFAAGVSEGIRAAETVLLVVSAKDGVGVGTEKAYRLATRMNKSKAFFINKLDVEHADFYKTFEGIKEVFGNSVCPVIIPHMEGDAVDCYIDLVDDKAYKFDPKANKLNEIAIPAAAADRIEEMKMALNEAVAETDDELMEKFFMEEPFTKEEIQKGIAAGVKSGTIAPVFCGSAATGSGSQVLMDAIVHFLPSAADGCCEETVEGETVKCDPDAPEAAFVFKTVADPFVGKLSFVKVITGKLAAGMTPVNARTGEPERLGKLLCCRGKKQDEVDAICDGDIGAVTKLSNAVTGDTLCDAKRVISFKPTEFQAPCLSMAIVLKGKGDEAKIAGAMQRLIEEDPCIGFENNVETKQQVISGLGEQHLDVVVSKLKSKFGIDVGLVKPRVAYRETIRKKVRVQGKHKKQSGGHGQYGDVWIEFEPCDSDSLVFEEKVVGGSVPKNFFPAVEKGLQDCVSRGMIAGYPVVGLKAILVDGSYHPVDSNEMAFKTAASLAYKAGLPQANPVILEPIGTLKVQVPAANMGDINSELSKRRGRMLGMNPAEDGLQEIEAEVPMSEMFDFPTALRSITQGRGSFTLTFAHYEQLPKEKEAEVIAEAKSMMEEE